jgi:hypothetical protein
MVELLESGCGLVIGTVSTDGEPRACRGWGLDVLDRDAGRIRLLVDGDDPQVLANLAEQRRVAVTGTDVVTLRSVQVKGTVAALEAPGDEAWARALQHSDAFFGTITMVDGNPREQLERMLPAELVVCTFVVDEVYDQTPGPAAGRAIGGGHA